MRIKTSLFILVFIILVKPLIGQNYPSYMYPQHLRPNDPNIVALGYTGTANRDGLFAPYSNPAGLASIDRFELGYTGIPSHTIIFFDNNNDYFGQNSISAGIPINRYLAVGLYYFNLALGELSIPDDQGNFGKKTKTGIRQYMISAALKYEFANKALISLGSNIKYLNEYFGYIDGSCVLYDFGIRYRIVSNNHSILLGLALTNFGSDMKYYSENSDKIEFKEEIIKLLKVGIAFGNSKINTENVSVKLAYEFSMEYQQNLKSDIYSDLWQTIGCGFELCLFKHLFAQVGYVYDLNHKEHDLDFKGLTYGFGFKTPEDIKIIKPISIALSYGRGIKIGMLDVDIVSISLGWKIN